MRLQKNYSVWALTVFSFMFLSYGCSSPILYNSLRIDRDIIIDGWDDDWEKNSMIVIEDRIAVGMKYDDEFIYIGVAPMTHQTAMQMMMTGFTVWFDTTGSGKKSFGIRYPLGMPGGPMMMPFKPPKGHKKENRDPMEDFAKKQLKELELIQSGIRSRIPVADLQGILIKLNMKKEGMFYEMKIPIRASDRFPFVIQVKPDKPLSVGFETCEFKKTDYDRNERMDGGAGVDFGGGGRPAGGPMNRDGFEKPKALKFWIKTTLRPVSNPDF